MGPTLHECYLHCMYLKFCTNGQVTETCKDKIIYRVNTKTLLDFKNL